MRVNKILLIYFIYICLSLVHQLIDGNIEHDIIRGKAEDDTGNLICYWLEWDAMNWILEYKHNLEVTDKCI